MNGTRSHILHRTSPLREEQFFPEIKKITEMRAAFRSLR